MLYDYPRNSQIDCHVGIIEHCKFKAAMPCNIIYYRIVHKTIIHIPQGSPHQQTQRESIMLQVSFLDDNIKYACDQKRLYPFEIIPQKFKHRKSNASVKMQLQIDTSALMIIAA